MVNDEAISTPFLLLKLVAIMQGFNIKGSSYYKDSPPPQCPLKPCQNRCGGICFDMEVKFIKT
jgi:hypothetical protein